jgi:hypothetical protein
MAIEKISLRKRGSSFSAGDILYPVTSWNYLVDKPSSFNPAPHNHGVDDITGGGAYSVKVTGTNGATGYWTASHPDITSYYDGMIIALFTNNYAGTGAGTRLNINGLGDKRIYYNDNSSLTTHYGPETLIILYYDANQDRFYCHDFYY